MTVVGRVLPMRNSASTMFSVYGNVRSARWPPFIAAPSPAPASGPKPLPLWPGVSPSRAVPCAGIFRPRLPSPVRRRRLYCSFALAAHEFFNSINPITFRTINVFFAMLSARIGFLSITTDAGIAEVHTEKCPESAGNYNGPAQGALPGLPIMLVPMRPRLSVPCACSVGVASNVLRQGLQGGRTAGAPRRRSFRGF